MVQHVFRGVTDVFLDVGLVFAPLQDKMLDGGDGEMTDIPHFDPSRTVAGG